MNYFNSQPHEEADAAKDETPITFNISTHSLTKRLTAYKILYMFFHIHFNSQPHEEADISVESSCSLRKDFNSQPHEEADCRSIQRMQGFSYFNSQPHEEADGPKNPTLFFYVISTHSLTKRLTDLEWSNQRKLDFNSQPHEEADGNLPKLLSCVNISTHSLTKRLTPSMEKVYRGDVYFNSQPHEEADGCTR